MENRKIYEEYKKEHPEEMVRLNALMRTSKHIQKNLDDRRQAKIRKIEECRRILYGAQYTE